MSSGSAVRFVAISNLFRATEASLLLPYGLKRLEERMIIDFMLRFQKSRIELSCARWRLIVKETKIRAVYEP